MCVTKCNNNNNKRPLTPKSMPLTGNEHRQLLQTSNAWLEAICGLCCVALDPPSCEVGWSVGGGCRGGRCAGGKCVGGGLGLMRGGCG